MTFSLMVAALLTSAASAPAPASTPAPAPAPAIPTDDDLAGSIGNADATLFSLFFEGCDPATLRTMVTDDLEFYHDKGGLVAISGDAFVADYARNCEARKAPDAWRSRRALVAETLLVDPVPGFGAMEAGDHQFYERQGDGPEKLVGRAAFAMVWRWVDGRWKLHRVLSYAHRADQ